MPAKKQSKATGQRQAKAATQQPQPVPDIVGNPDARTHSAQQIRLLYSFFDFVIILGELRLKDDGQVNLVESARVTLSPQHLKALAGLLVRKVAEYESEHGPIPEPTPLAD